MIIIKKVGQVVLEHSSHCDKSKQVRLVQVVGPRVVEYSYSYHLVILHGGMQPSYIILYCLATVQSSYNFTNSRVATHFHAWLHAKSCRVPRLVAACPTPCQRVVTRKKLLCATLNSCVSHVYGCSRVVLATRLHL